jgi:hypothetical protein
VDVVTGESREIDEDGTFVCNICIFGALCFVFCWYMFFDGE